MIIEIQKGLFFCITSVPLPTYVRRYLEVFKLLLYLRTLNSTLLNIYRMKTTDSAMFYVFTE